MRVPGQLVALGFAMAFLLSGCSKPQPPIGEVEGILTLNGKPFSDGAVVFMPEASSEPSMSAVGLTDSEGKFVLRRPDENKDGTYTGTYKVVVEDTKALEELSANFRHPKKYASVLTTTLTVEVKPGKQSIQLDMRGQPDAPIRR